MVQINRVILCGYLGRDPEIVTTQSGSQIARISLATSRSFKDRNGERVKETEWHNVLVFGKQAEVAGQYLRKGSEMFVEGRLRTRSYEGKDGVKRYVTEILGERFQLGARPQQEGTQADPATGKPQTASQQYAAAASQQGQGAAFADEDMPF